MLPRLAPALALAVVALLSLPAIPADIGLSGEHASDRITGPVVAPDALELPAGPVAEGAVPPGRVFAHDSLGNPLPLPGALDSIVFRVSDVGKKGPEPSVGVDSQGRIFFQALTRTVRSADEGLTWKDVTPNTATTTTADPLGWLDVDTDRWYNDQLKLSTPFGGGCSHAVWTDLAGELWNGYNPYFCQTPPEGRVDHQKINTGRVPPEMLPVQPAFLAPYKSAVYFAWNAVPGSKIAMSLDGGQTFPLVAETVPSGTTCSGGLHGRPRSLPDGTLLLPKRDCGGPVVAWSRNFDTWERVKVGASVGSTDHRKNPDIAVDTEGNAYVFWPSGSSSGIGAEPTWMSASRDGGKTWGSPGLASPPSVLSSTFHAAVAGAPGKVAVMYYGNDHSAAAPDHVDFASRWHAYVSFSLNALDANPTWVTVQLDTDSDPIQIGPISTNTHHAPSGSRNLLDFNDLVRTKEGRVVAAYADGCTSFRNCANNPNATLNDSRDNEGIAAILLSGISLL